MALTPEESSLLKSFASDQLLLNHSYWGFLGDLFLMAGHPDGDRWFRDRFGDYPGIREVMQKLLEEDRLLADRFESLKHWHAQSGKVHLVKNGQSERKRQIGIVSAITNFADAFRNIVASL